MKEIYNEELLDAYDENIETIDDLNNDQALKEEINRMKGEEDVNKEVTMQDYEKYLGILAMVRTTERLQDSDELTKEALEQTLHEQ